MQAARPRCRRGSSRTSRTLGGSPRAIHELVRLLLESDVIVREGYLWRLDADKLADDDAAEDVRGARRRAPARDGADRASRARDGGGRRRDVVARRGPRARALEPAGHAIPTARRWRRSRRRGDHSRARGRRRDRQARRARVDRRGPAVERVGRARAALRVSEPVVDRLQVRSTRRAAAAITRSSRAGSSCTPRAAAPAAQEEVGRHLALAGDAARGRAALPPRRRGRARAVRERARDPAVRSRARLHRRRTITRRASTCGTTSARSTS